MNDDDDLFACFRACTPTIGNFLCMLFWIAVGGACLAALAELAS